MLAIAPTDQAAEAVARRGAESTTGSYAKGVFADGQDPVSRHVDDVIVWGCPERVANELIRFREEKQLPQQERRNQNGETPLGNRGVAHDALSLHHGEVQGEQL